MKSGFVFQSLGFLVTLTYCDTAICYSDGRYSHVMLSAVWHRILLAITEAKYPSSVVKIFR